MRADTDIDLMRRHLDYLLEKLGEDGVGRGSDFDGAIVQGEIGSVAGPGGARLASARGGLFRRASEEDHVRKLLERIWS